MSSQQQRQDLLESLAEPVCAAHGVELVEIRQVQGRKSLTIRVMIDRDRPASDPRPGSGVTVDDCANVSRDLSTALDVHEDDFPGTFSLEVSSPGLDRPLVKPAHYARFVGEKAKIKLEIELPDAPKRRQYSGTILRLETTADVASVVLEVDGSEVLIPLSHVSRANLIPTF